MLAACCDPLFSPADEYNPLASRWLAVATAADAPNSVCLFYSLLNTILTFDPTQGVYSYGFSDSHTKLVELSAQVMCVLLDCGLPWLTELKESFPLETVTRLLQHLVPVVDEIVASKQGVVRLRQRRQQRIRQYSSKMHLGSLQRRVLVPGE